MALAILGRSPAVHRTVARWRYRAGGLILWSAILLIVVYPLSMVIATALAPAFPDTQPLTLIDLLSARVVTAAINTLRLDVSVSLLSLIMAPHWRWSPCKAAATAGSI